MATGARLRELGRLLVGACVLSVMAYVPPARACGSCRGPSGPGATLTAPWQRFGMQVTLSSRVAHGYFLEGSAYSPLGASARDTNVDIGIGAGYRLLPRLEAQVAIGLGRTALALPGYSRAAVGVSDLQLRARYELYSEPGVRIPGRNSPPSLGLSLSLRAPTGSEGRGANGGAQTQREAK
jgi:hypothetical protein